MKNAMIVPLSL